MELMAKQMQQKYNMLNNKFVERYYLDNFLNPRDPIILSEDDVFGV